MDYSDDCADAWLGAFDEEAENTCPWCGALRPFEAHQDTPDGSPCEGVQHEGLPGI